MRYVIAYDVTKNKQRTQLSDLLLGYGERVQKSVFEADLKKEDVQEILQRASKLIEPGDSVRLYPMCETCSRGIVTQGRATLDLHISFRIV